MKKWLLVSLLLFPSLALAQGVPSQDQFTSTTSPSLSITQKVYGKTIRLTGLENLGCIGTDSNGILQAGTCSGGGGGGTGVATTSILSIWPIIRTLSTAALTFSFGGISTSTNPTIGQIPYWTGVNTIGSVATGTVSAGSSAITVTAGRSVIGGALSIDCTAASGSQNGCLSSTDWTTFNNKISFVWPFTPTTYGTLQVSATSTAFEDFAGLISATSTIGTLTASSSITNQGVKSALVLNSAAGLEGAYGGASACSANNFVTTISAIGGTTCGTATISGVSLGGTLAALSATDATLTFSGSYTGAAARTVGLNLANANSWSAKQTFVSASSTNLSASGSFFAPSAASTTLNASGAIAIDTTVASSGISYFDGTAQRLAPNIMPVSFMWNTTTPSTSATDTGMIINGARPIKLDNAACSVVGGTATIAVGNGVSTSTYIQAKALSTVPVPVTLSSNNSFTQFAPIFIAIGTYSANTVTTVSCGYGEEYTG